MRGRKQLSRLSHYETPRESLAPTTSRTVTAPVGGWNTSTALANMKPIYAVVMDNFYPQAGDVILRPGRLQWATGSVGDIKTLIPYNSGSTNKLFAASASGVYDVTAGGAIGAAVTPATNGKWESRNFRNAGGSWLTMVNGVDKYKIYDGTTWTIVDAVSAPAVTGVATTDLTNIHLFKRRLWFTVKQSLSAWYLAVDAIAGALAEFPMGPIFGKGGYIVAQESWTIDGGQGQDDYLVTVTSEGQMAIYQGIDPATDFILVGVYAVGKPLGKRCLLKYGGDVLYLSKNGIFVLSKLLLSATIDRSNSLSDKIDEAFKKSVAQYSNTFGWQAILHPTQNSLIVNIPMQEASVSVQYVMNNLTKAWCRFTGWSMDCQIDFQDDVYGAVNGKVYKLWQGTNDAGVSIAGSCQQAYITLGSAYVVALVRPNLSIQGTLTVQTAIDTDFALFNGVVESSYITYATSAAFWDSSLWDSAIWSEGLTPVSRQWMTNANNPGIFHSFRLQTTSSNAMVSWPSTDFGVMGTGLL